MQFFSFEELPEEMRAAIESENDRRKMQDSSKAHDISRLFQELDQDSLIAMKLVLNHIAGAGHPGGALTAAYFDGQCTALLNSKYNLCPACGVDHDAAAADLLEEDDGPGLQHGDVWIISGDERAAFREWLERGETQSEPVSADQLTIEDADPEPPVATIEVLKLLEEYHVSPIVPPSFGTILTLDTAVQCNDCGQDYVSLKDRMIKAPGVNGCGGCQHKAKWG